MIPDIASQKRKRGRPPGSRNKKRGQTAEDGADAGPSRKRAKNDNMSQDSDKLESIMYPGKKRGQAVVQD